jgi:hypothetical protein
MIGEIYTGDCMDAVKDYINDVKKQHIRKMLIEEINKNGFPVAFITDYADQAYGIIAYSPTKYKLISYADDEHGTGVKSFDDLTDLDLFHLAYGLRNEKEIKGLEEEWTFEGEEGEGESEDDEGQE